jgi:hypothetical protein
MSDRFDRFTERAKRVLVLAHQEAQRFNHSHIGTEHILLGLVHEGQGIAAGVLESLGVQLASVRAEVIRVLSAPPSSGEPAPGRTPAPPAPPSPRPVTSHGGARPTGAPPPPPGAWMWEGSADLGELQDVIGVGRTAQVGKSTVTLLSLERYYAGFVLQFRLQCSIPSDAPQTAGPRPMLVPAIPLEVADDTGTNYTLMGHGASGGAGASALTWRLAYRGTPAIPAPARELRLVVPSISWQTYSPAAGTYTVWGVDSGRWLHSLELSPHPPASPPLRGDGA